MSLESPAFREETNPAFSLPKNIYIKKTPPFGLNPMYLIPRRNCLFGHFMAAAALIFVSRLHTTESNSYSEGSHKLFLSGSLRNLTGLPNHLPQPAFPPPGTSLETSPPIPADSLAVPRSDY